jgi:hypothetical protein
MNFAIPSNVRPHWNYFLALEKDLEGLSRYIEFCKDNLDTYSIELAHLLLSSASEIDTIAKCVCGILDPKAKPKNIDQYRKIIRAAEENETCFTFRAGAPPVLPEDQKQRMSDLKVHLPRYNMALIPWKSWAEDKNPDWWKSYNDVKHERNKHFNKATLKNALCSVAGLLSINYIYCRLELTRDKPHYRYQYRGKNVTSYMEPASTLLRFEPDFYYDPIASLGSYISSVSKDVHRISGKMDERD